MDYVQYTHCRQPKDHLQLNQYVSAALQGALGAGIAMLLLVAAGRIDCWPYAALVGAIFFLLGYCYWWLDDRLLCLGGDRRAVGMLISYTRPEDKHFFGGSFPFIDPDAFDTDYSLNLLPYDAAEGVQQTNVDPTKALDPLKPYQDLAIEKEVTKKEGLPFTGETGTNDANKITSAALHAEFEGGGVADLLLATQIALGLATAALIVCLGVPPPWGTIIAALLALLAILAMLIGGGIGLNDGASPSDVGMGELHLNDKSTKIGADILGVEGTWVYDAGHNNKDKGWNEIHPIKSCQKLDTWGAGGWPATLDQKITDWNAKVDDKSSPLTTGNQEDPAHQWTLYPLIDGCTPTDGLICGTIRWPDELLHFNPEAVLFTIAALGPDSPPFPGQILGSPGPLLATGSVVGPPRQIGTRWAVTYGILHVPFGGATVVISCNEGAWTIKPLGFKSIVVTPISNYVSGNAPLILSAENWQITGIDFELSVEKMIG